MHNSPLYRVQLPIKFRMLKDEKNSSTPAKPLQSNDVISLLAHDLFVQLYTTMNDSDTYFFSDF